MTSPTNEQHRVDVLLRMDAAIGSMQMFHLGTEALEEARAAVAELIEAARAYRQRNIDPQARDRLDAALANVGAQK